MQKQILNPWKQSQICRLNIKCGHSIIVDSCKHCQKIQRQWYRKLKKKGFEDIEDVGLRLLKKWTGVNDLINPIRTQEPNIPIESSWPEVHFQKEQTFLNHPSFNSICESLFKHGNNAITAIKMIKIWECHCEGYSLREIEKQSNIHYLAVYRAINKLKGMADLMNDESKVVIREFNPGMDSPLLFASWRHCLWFDAHPADTKPNPIFYRLTTKKINSLLRDPHTKVKIACLSDDSNEIKGYAVLTNQTIQFVYVKLDYRKQGIATLLTKGFVDIIKPSTKIGTAIALKKNLKEKQDGREETEKEQTI